jgi:hypothetical protein
MIEELSDHVWKNPKLHVTAKRAQMAWLKRELGMDDDSGLTVEDATKLVRAAAILACSESPEHRALAFRSATCVYDLANKAELPLDQALRVVLTRLGNFPSLATREDVNRNEAQRAFREKGP